MEDRGVVTVKFLGVSALGGGQQFVEVPVSSRMTVRDVLQSAVEALGQTVTPDQIKDLCLVLVQGHSIEDLQEWDTPVTAGSKVSVVPLVGGG